MLSMQIMVAKILHIVCGLDKVPCRSSGFHNSICPLEGRHGDKPGRKKGPFGTLLWSP